MLASSRLRRSTKAAPIAYDKIGAYADNGSAEDAATMIRQLQAEITRARAQQGINIERLDELVRQRDREIEDRLAKLPDLITASYEPYIDEVRQAMLTVVDEQYALVQALDDWQVVLDERLQAEAQAS